LIPSSLLAIAALIGSCTIGVAAAVPKDTSARPEKACQPQLKGSRHQTMPRPTRLTHVRHIDNGDVGGVTLAPTASGVRPHVTAASARPKMGHAIRRDGRYQLVFAMWTSAIPSAIGVAESQDVTAWVLIGSHVPMVPIGSAQPSSQARCFFMRVLVPVNSLTGQEMGMFSWP
jgi:hypothetical protein